MKKIIIIFICLTLFLMGSCKENKEPVIEINVVDSTIREVYYVDEFNITTISITVSIDGVVNEEVLTPLLIENYPNELKPGSYTFIINYEGIKKELTLNFIEREFYTEGLEFNLNASQDAYAIVGYSGTSTEVVIPETFNFLPVESIKAYAFNNNKLIEKVYLPNTIKQIQSNAFSNCSSLKDINIPNSCTDIADAAFYYCDSLRSVKIPSSVKTIGEYAFYTTVIVYTDKQDISSWHNNAFDDNLVCIHKGIDLNKIINLANFEFYLDESATLLNYNGTENQVIIPNEVDGKLVTKIDNAAFMNNLNLEEIVIPENITYIADRAFRETGLISVEIPGSVKEIGVYSFSGCQYLETVTFNEGLEKINISAFAACPKLTTAILPSTLKTIEQYGFQNCHLLQTVFIPKSVIYIGEGAFYSCSKATLYIELDQLPSTWASNFNPSKAKLSFNASKEDM